jgi:hypothetical protein
MTLEFDAVGGAPKGNDAGAPEDLKQKWVYLERLFFTFGTN